MRNFFNFKSKTLFVLVGTAAALGTTACVDDTYSLDKEISTQVQIAGDGFSLPVGSTEKIFVIDYLSEVEDLTNEDGVYGFSMKDTISEKFALDPIAIEGMTEQKSFSAGISNVKIEAFDFNQTQTTDLAINAGNVELASQSTSSQAELPLVTKGQFDYIAGNNFLVGTTLPIPVELNKTETYSLDNLMGNVVCPEQIASVNKIYFGSKSNTKGSLLQISLDISSAAGIFSAYTTTYDNITLSMPEGFVLAKNPACPINYTITGSTVEMRNVVVSNGVLDFSVYIAAYDKVLNNNNGSLDAVSGVVSMSFTKVNIEGTVKAFSAPSPAIGVGINIATELEVRDMEFTLAAVEFDLPENNISNDVEFDNLPVELNDINRVEFKSGSAITFEISKIDLGEMDVNNSSDDIIVEFDASLFEFAPNSALSKVGNKYQLAISADQIINAPYDYYNELEIIALNLDNKINFTKYEVEGVQKQKGAFAMDITVKPAKVSLGGDMSLAAFEALESQQVVIAAKSQNIEIEGIEIDMAEIVAEIPAEDVPIEISQAIPSALVSIHKIALTEPVNIDLDIVAENVPTSLGEMKISNYTVNLPKFLVFTPESGVGAGNKLVINEAFAKDGDSRSFHKRLTITELNFEDASYDNMIQDNPESKDDNDAKLLVLNELITMDGNIAIAAGNVSTGSEIEDITGSVNMTLGDMQVGVVEGVVAPAVEIPAQSIDLGDLSSALGDDIDVALTLSNPTISLKAKNPLGANIEVNEIKLVSRDADSVELLTITTERFVLPGDNNIYDDQIPEQTIIISRTGAAAAGQVGVKCENLRALLQNLPSYIDITIDAGVEAPASGSYHSFDLSKDYEIELEYEVKVPLQFEDLVLNVNTTIGNLSESMSTITDYVTNARIYVEIENTVPAQLCITDVEVLGKLADPEDEDSHRETIETAPVVDPANNTIGAATIVDGKIIPSITSLVLNINEGGNEGALESMDALRIAIEAKTPEGVQAVINDEQYLKLKLSLEVPEGIVIDIADFEDSEEEE